MNRHIVRYDDCQAYGVRFERLWLRSIVDGTLCDDCMPNYLKYVKAI
jgi:hypothetical protein